MAVYHRTQRLQIYGEKPEVTKLFGDRYRMVVRCKAARDTEAWYNDNKDQIFADFGTLYGAQMSVDGIDPRAGEAYPDMCLVSNSASYTQTGEYVISFVYETLTSVWTKEQDDEITSTDNGLRVLQRSEVATIDAAAPYDEDDVGVATITDGGKTLYLANFQDQTGADSDAQVGRVVTRWAEAGILSRTEDFVGSQDSLVIEAIGPDPSTPAGFSLASKQESNYEGFQTNRFTFLKNDVQLSQTEDKVGSQLAISQQWFNPSADKTIAGYSLASKNTSDFEGIKTIEFRFLKDNTELSRSEDKVGSQLAITTEVFNPTTNPAEAGYSVARTEVSDVDGIPTKRFTFLKPSILSVRTPKVGGQQQVVVSAFGMTSAEVGSDLSEVTANHKLVNQSDSDYEGIKTSNYTFEVDDFDVLSATENGLNQLTRTQLDTDAFTRGIVGTDTYSSLILAGEEIDNSNTIKKRVSRWAEAGLLDAYSEVNDGIRYVSFTSQGTRVTPTALNASYSLTSEPELAFQGGATAPIYRARTKNVEGFKNFVTVVMLNVDGTPLATGDEVTSFTTWENYNYPGEVLLNRTEGILPKAGGDVAVLVTISESLNTTGTVGASPVPFSIKKGCFATINYIPTATGLAAALTKSYGINYLVGTASITGSGGQFLGMDVSSIAGSASSDPTYATFLATNNPILERKIIDEFVTDEGVRWYRIRQKQLVGTFGAYD